MKLQARKPETRDRQKKNPKTSRLKQLAVAAGASATIALSGLLGSGCVNNQRNPTQIENSNRIYTAEELEFREFIAGTPRAQILWNEPDTYRITMSFGVITEDGRSMSIEQYDEARERSELPLFRRFVRFLLYEPTIDDNIFRLRNPRYDPENNEPEYLGIANVRDGVVYRAERVMDPAIGEIWIPHDENGSPEVLYRIGNQLAPISNGQYDGLAASEDAPFFRGGMNGVLVIPRWGPPPIPVGYIARPIPREQTE